MSTTLPLGVLRSIFHPTDFTAGSEVAFAHALKLALVAGATLHVMHASTSKVRDWRQFPGVRSMLARWGLLAADSPRHAVADLGIEVRKVIAHERDPVTACLRFLDGHHADLIVLAVHQRDRRMRWLQAAVAEPLARRAGQATLFIPYGIEGFVSRRDGSLSLRKVLAPVIARPAAHGALDTTARLVRVLAPDAGTVRVLHVGTAAHAPALALQRDGGWTWTPVNAQGDAVATILDHARTLPADLVVMTTAGPDGFLDGLRGTTSEQVLRDAPCPVLIVPAAAHA